MDNLIILRNNLSMDKLNSYRILSIFELNTGSILNK